MHMEQVSYEKLKITSSSRTYKTLHHKASYSLLFGNR